MRRTLTLASIALGVLLMVVSYFFLGAPWGTESVANSDPRLPFAPALFVLGVIFLFGSAVIYELLPDGQGRER